MLEETSTSSSAAAGASPEDLFRSPTAVVSAGDSSTSATAQALHFSSGNPRIEEIRGVVHLYHDDVASSSAQLPVDRKPLISVLGVPNHMTYADFCQFCGSFIHHILEMRIVRTEGLEDRYSILIRLDDQNSADSFYKHFNGKRFSSLEEETCRMFFTVDIQYTGSIEHSQSSPASSTEQPSCPRDWTKIQVEFLLQSAITPFTALAFLDGLILLARWVCRYCQQQPEKSICYVCQTLENLWMCVICGFVGCGRYKEGHAISHWKETQHCYSLELETQRVWDYAGDNYVHRLIQSKTDGKLVELNHHCSHNNDGYSDTLLDNEIVNEYNDLLTSQLESQKTYFETLLQEVEEDTERESSIAVEKALSQNPKLLKMQTKLDKWIEEKRFLDDINDNLVRNQGIWESKIVEIEEREKKLLKLKDEKIEELEEQLRHMMACLETDNAEQHPTTSNEPKDGSVEPVVAESSSKNGSRGATKTNSRRKNKG
ncbi:hypothetical protein DH2020_038288 [Rehmannia glutinosa]|uniref:UBP-type domain-containing protein n=1 Tax=Rehmannia glutinosa TaxID=99300 RepID=A0ABR0UZE3_REHGL